MPQVFSLCSRGMASVIKRPRPLHATHRRLGRTRSKGRRDLRRLQEVEGKCMGLSSCFGGGKTGELHRKLGT